MIPTAIEHAKASFQYREQVTGRKLPHDPDWPKVMREAEAAALAGDRGSTDQQQCAYQAIRLEAWESGRVLVPWTKAFLPVAVRAIWYKRWWAKIAAWYQSFLKHLNDRL
jgi:hypothetical protein